MWVSLSCIFREDQEDRGISLNQSVGLMAMTILRNNKDDSIIGWHFSFCDQ